MRSSIVVLVHPRTTVRYRLPRHLRSLSSAMGKVDDHHHARFDAMVRELSSRGLRLITTWPCIVEASYLLEIPHRFEMLKWIELGGEKSQLSKNSLRISCRSVANLFFEPEDRNRSLGLKPPRS
jgi:hypothetical protein